MPPSDASSSDHLNSPTLIMGETFSRSSSSCSGVGVSDSPHYAGKGLHAQGASGKSLSSAIESSAAALASRPSDLCSKQEAQTLAGKVFAGLDAKNDAVAQNRGSLSMKEEDWFIRRPGEARRAWERRARQKERKRAGKARARKKKKTVQEVVNKSS